MAKAETLKFMRAELRAWDRRAQYEHLDVDYSEKISISWCLDSLSQTPSEECDKPLIRADLLALKKKYGGRYKVAKIVKWW